MFSVEFNYGFLILFDHDLIKLIHIILIDIIIKGLLFFEILIDGYLLD